jgi:transcriptional regulator with XRE-family HTH domain
MIITYKHVVPGRNSPKSKKLNLFGPKLKALRIAKGLTAVQVIARLGARGWDIGASTYSALESGDRIIADTELMLICKVLGVTLSDLERN